MPTWLAKRLACLADALACLAEALACLAEALACLMEALACLADAPACRSRLGVSANAADTTSSQFSLTRIFLTPYGPPLNSADDQWLTNA
jgi:hypothetical protein